MKTSPQDVFLQPIKNMQFNLNFMFNHKEAALHRHNSV